MSYTRDLDIPRNTRLTRTLTRTLPAPVSMAGTDIVVLNEPPKPAPETSSSPVRDESSESPKEEDFSEEDGSAEFFKTYTSYKKQGVANDDPIKKFMKKALKKISGIQAKLDSLEEKHLMLEGQVESNNTYLRSQVKELGEKFEGKANETNFYLALHDDAILGSVRAVDCILVRRLVESLQKTVAIGLKITAESFDFFRVSDVAYMTRDENVKDYCLPKPTVKDCKIHTAFGLQHDFDPLHLPRLDDVGFDYLNFELSVEAAVKMSTLWFLRVPGKNDYNKRLPSDLPDQLEFLNVYMEICYGLHRQRATDALELAKRFAKNPDLPRDTLKMFSMLEELNDQTRSDDDEDVWVMITSFVVHESTAMKLEKAIELVGKKTTRELCTRSSKEGEATRRYTNAGAHGLFAAPHALQRVGERIKAHGKVPLELYDLADTFDDLALTLFRDRTSSQREVDSKLQSDAAVEEKDAVRTFDELNKGQQHELVKQVALKKEDVQGDPLTYSFTTDQLAPTFAEPGFFKRAQTTRSAMPAGSLSLRDRITPASGSSVSSVQQGTHFHDRGRGRSRATAIRQTSPVGPERSSVGSERSRDSLLNRISSFPVDNYYDYESGSKRASETDEGQGSSRKRMKKRF